MKKDATLLDDLLALVNPSERGDPMSPLRWTCKSLSQLASALVAQGHRIGRTVVGELLHRQKFSLQANRKTREGDSHPDRNAQFVHINDSVTAALTAGEPRGRKTARGVVRKAAEATSRSESFGRLAGP